MVSRSIMCWSCLTFPGQLNSVSPFSPESASRLAVELERFQSELFVFSVPLCEISHQTRSVGGLLTHTCAWCVS